MSTNQSLPRGCQLIATSPIDDHRGQLTEVYRQEWVETEARIQWNVVRSVPGTLRGVHVHRNRTDYLVIVDGEMWLGLYDMRRSEPTFGQSSLVRLSPEENQSAYIPTGVAHGFYFTKPTVTLYGLSDYFSMDDDFGCDPDDAGLGIEWPGHERLLSPRDQAAGTLAEMQQQYDEWLEQKNG